MTATAAAPTRRRGGPGTASTVLGTLGRLILIQGGLLCIPLVVVLAAREWQAAPAFLLPAALCGTVGAGMAKDGGTISDLTGQRKFPDNVNVVCVFRDATERFEVAGPATPISAGDRIFLCGRREDLRSAASVIRG